MTPGLRGPRFALPYALLMLGLAFALAMWAARAAYAAPPAEVVSIRGVVAGDYTFTDADAGSSNTFFLSRAELGTRWSWSAAAALDLQIEAVRSASPESLFGVDGNALVLALARAYVDLTPELGPGHLELRLGLVPDPLAATIEDAYRLRLLRDVLLVGGGFGWRSDLGLSVGWREAADRVSIVAQVTNGEGPRELELDRSKDLLALAVVVPWRADMWGDDASLRLALGYRHGTRGVASIAHDRLSFLAAFVHPSLGAGVEGHLAWGFADRADRDALGIGVWLFGAPWDVLGAAARLDWRRLDLDVGDSDEVVVDAAVIVDLGLLAEARPQRLRLRVGGRFLRVGGSAAAVPGLATTSDADSFLVTLEAAADTGLD